MGKVVTGTVEEWKDISGYKGLYEVSSFGNVRSRDRTDNKGHYIKGKLLKIDVTNEGRCIVSLSKNGNVKKYQVHRLVAKAFVDNPCYYKTINHIDEDPTNNRADNLQWCTGWYNNCYSFNKHLICESIITGRRKFYESVNEAASDGFNKGHVAAVCRGEERQHKGFRFKYVTDEKYIIGVDESYKRCGITLLCDGLIVKMFSVCFENCMNNTDKREMIYEKITDLCREYRLEKRNCSCIIERIRLFSKGIISENYVIATSALVAKIIDVLSEYDIPVYSVNTKTWKSAIIGTSKPMNNKYDINPEKYPTILYMHRKGLLEPLLIPYHGKGKKGIIPVRVRGEHALYEVNDDLADSYCIALYGFLPEHKQKLKEEQF